jgi:hypothetical protein
MISVVAGGLDDVPLLGARSTRAKIVTSSLCPTENDWTTMGEVSDHDLYAQLDYQRGTRHRHWY